MLFRYCIFFFLLVNLVEAYSLKLYWPTPNKAFQEDQPMSAYIQPTASGRVESGLFGCYRNGGNRFHEGIDIKPVKRNRKQEPQDVIYAILPGKVVYINKVGGNSAYGRYIVIEHQHMELPLTSLYAHLSQVDPGIEVGRQVRGGQVIGVMGHSASSPIPVSRSHLHLEIGVRLSDYFDTWYRKQKFSTPNKHGLWNGMNLLGIDPLDFFRKANTSEWKGEVHYIQSLPTAFIFKVTTTMIPDFIRRYPQLLDADSLPKKVYGWKIECTWFGFPKKWTPIIHAEPLLGKNGHIHIVMYDSHLLLKNRGAKMVNFDKAHVQPGLRLRKLVAILFAQ